MDITPWYAPAMLVPNDELLNRRKKGTAAFVSNVQPDQILDLVRLAFGLDRTGIDLDKLMKPYNDADETFAASEKNNAIEVLAGCVLATLMSESRSHGLIAALAIQCAASGLKRSAVHHPQLVEMSASVCDSGVVSPNAGPPNLGQLKDTISKSVAPLTNESAPPNIAQAVKVLGDATVGALNEIDRYQNAIPTALAAQQQQIDILWWMLGEWSESLSGPFDKLKNGVAAIAAGFDLAKLTQTRDIPRSTKAVLHRVVSRALGGAAEKLDLIAAVNGCSKAWREGVKLSVRTETVKEICPVLLAISTSLATASADHWKPVFQKALGSDAIPEFTAIDLAVQTYRELLLVKLTSQRAQ